VLLSLFFSARLSQQNHAVVHTARAVPLDTTMDRGITVSIGIKKNDQAVNDATPIRRKTLVQRRKAKTL
jgi:hypothetical protein